MRIEEVLLRFSAGSSTELGDKVGKLAVDMWYSTPNNREQSLALTALEEALFWANASIARGIRGDA